MNKQSIILAAALQLFVDNGFHGTATSKIAQEAGIANGTLFNYFKTKEELILTLYHSVLKEMDDFIMEKMPSQSISKESFRSLFMASLSWSIEHPLQYQYMQLFNHSPFFKTVNPMILNQEEHPLYNLIQKAMDVVLIRQLPVPFVFSLFTAQISGLQTYIIQNRLTNQLQTALVQEAFEMFWRMIED